jgi:1-acyl-sn-glycerol-3-phosphate acyltransferase
MQIKTLRTFFRFLFTTLSRVEIKGMENVPSTGGCILASNHVGILDAPLVFVFIEREDITALVADKYRHKFPINWLVNSVQAIWIKREEADLSALRQAREFLAKGGILGIAPEGTRSQTGGLAPAKTGVAYLADKAGVPVVPVAVTGAESGVRKLLLLRRPTFHIEFGEPITLPPVDRRDRDGSLQRNTDEIMCRIATMLPFDYRGVYAEHPRLKELVQK